MAATYPPYACTGGPSEERVLMMVQRISGALSVIGSSTIVYDVVKKSLRSVGATGRVDPYQRIMLGLSFCDFSSSFFDAFLGPWMTPKETGWLMAYGNQASCTAQGFFAAFGFFGAYGYNIALSLNTTMLIAFGWSQKKFAKLLEVPVHIVVLLIALAYSIVPLPFESYNADCGQCLWAPVYDESGNVIRGSEKIQSLWWKLDQVYLWLTISICTIAMVWVYFSVRKQENKMKKYSVRGDTADQKKESKRIRKILFLYTLSMLVSWGIPVTVIYISIELGAWPDKLPFALRATLEFLIPLQGFFNMLVYFLPQCLSYQRRHRGTWLITSYFHVLKPSIRCGSTIRERFSRSGTSATYNSFGRSGTRSRVTSREGPGDDSDTNFSKFNEPNKNAADKDKAQEESEEEQDMAKSRGMRFDIENDSSKQVHETREEPDEEDNIDQSD